MISYKLLDEAIQHYERQGYIRVETPWTVTKAIDNITKPPDKISFELIHNGKCLVASGEQSFLYQYCKDYLPKGRFQTVTPCFRFEDYDALHSKVFMKNELINTVSVNTSNLDSMVASAFGFFSNHFNKNSLSIDKTSDGFDIHVNGKELGSYGIRECEFLKWIYGTGLAEPRTSRLIEFYDRNTTSTTHR
jgi:hypothetical protein